MTTAADILEFAAAFIDEHGYSPTVQEIGDAVGLTSKSSIHYHLERLRESGHVTWVDGQNRTLRVVETNRRDEDGDVYLRLPRALRDRLVVLARLMDLSESAFLTRVLDALDRPLPNRRNDTEGMAGG